MVGLPAGPQIGRTELVDLWKPPHVLSEVGHVAVECEDGGKTGGEDVFPSHRPVDTLPPSLLQSPPLQSH